MAITKLNSLAIPPNTIVESDLSYPLTNFSSTGIDDNAASTAVTIDASENVGIGTTSPSSKLEVSGKTIVGSDSSNALEVFSSGDTEIAFSYASKGNIYGKIIGDITQASPLGGDIAFQTATGGSLSERMRIDSSGSVGIGTSSPNANAKFEVVSTSAGAVTNVIQLRNGDATAGSGAKLQFLNSTVNYATAGTSEITGVRYSGNYSALTFTTYGPTSLVERMRIDGVGNVGIGTTSPNYPLHLNKSDSAGCWAQFTNSTTGTGSGAGALVGIDSNEDFRILQYEAKAIEFSTSATERARIDSSGRLMIGTTSPISTSAFLSLYQATGSVFGQTYGAAILNGEQSIWQAGARASGTGADRYCALSVYKHSGVTNAAPYLYLQEEDGNAAYYWTDNTGVLKYSNSAANVGTTGGGAVGAQTSDERLKNIEEGFEYGIETVKALTPIAYRRNDEESPERKLGFGAQTTQAIVPEVVFDTGDCLDGYDGEGIEATPKTDNTILGMEYVQLIPVLTKAIQEQQAMIEELKAEVAALKGA